MPCHYFAFVIFTVFALLYSLLQAISLLIRLSIYNLRNTSTQVVCGKDAIVCQAMSELDKLIQFTVDRDVHDLQVDFMVFVVAFV